MPSGCAGATGTAYRSAITVGKGCIGGSSDQPSSDDHAGEILHSTADPNIFFVGYLSKKTESFHFN
jgi:hypothetical protein